MPRISFDVETDRTPQDVVAILTDFSDRRPEIWPAFDPTFYRRIAQGPSWADVVEGGGPLPGMWARESYDWSEPGLVRAEIVESSLFRPGGRLEYTVRASASGSRIRVAWDRRPRSFRGAVITALVLLSGRKALADQLRAALAANLARPGAAGSDQATA